MCSPACENLIREVVREFVDGDRLFTAFDVSKETQCRLKAAGEPFERHRHMKNIIHRETEEFTTSGEYGRQLHDVGASTQAFLYFPPSADPNSYVPQDRPTTPVQVATTAVDDDDDDNDDNDEGDEQDTGRATDGRGTLCVPNHVLRAAGFNPQEVAYVEVDKVDGKPALILSKRSTNHVAAYTVDYCDNVRITKGTLTAAGLCSTTGYDFYRDGSDVIVQIH